MTQVSPIEVVSGAEIEIPLNKLKKSPRNARKTAHSPEAVEALAASIAAKRLLQKPVVEPERDASGAMTGFWLVTIGEGRRLALRLLAQRKQIAKGHVVPCLVDTECDPQEISLDENVTRSAMHPADQFEAFHDLHERKGWSAEEIAARFGVSPGLVRQRLRLASVSPRLIALYRQEDLGLDQLMAFAVCEDHERQESVYQQLSYNRSASFIRQALTAAKVSAGDRRAVLVGVEAYEAAGGRVTCDLVTEDRGGWLERCGAAGPACAAAASSARRRGRRPRGMEVGRGAARLSERSWPGAGLSPAGRARCGHSGADRRAGRRV